MATGLIKGTTRVAVMEEVTQGTYVAPDSADDYIQVLEDGLEMVPTKDLKERNILNNNIGKVRSRVGMKSAANEIPVELIGGGLEGGVPDYNLLLEGLLGSETLVTTQTTTKASGNTSTVLQIEDADISDFFVGAIFVILESGNHVINVATAVDTTLGAANITVLRAKPGGGSYSNSVVISKFASYQPANSGHPSLSVSTYWGNEIREAHLGCRPVSMSLENFTTGEIASLNFSLEGLNFTEVDGAAPHTPTFTQALPPLILRACVYQDGVQVDVNEVTLSVENTLGFITSTCNENGKIASRFTERVVSGTFNPYKDDTSVAQFTRFNTNAEFSLFFYAANPSSVSGEVEMGSVVGFWLPHCIITEKQVGDLDGILIEDISFMADRDEDGSEQEIFIGYV